MGEVDRNLLLLINGAHSPELDLLATFLSEWALYVFPIALALVAWAKGRGHALWASHGLLAWFLAMFIAESILKPLIGRTRPTADPELLVHLRVLGSVPSPRSLSFPSGTAAACAAGASWLGSVRIPSLTALFALVAIAACWARIYAGVHWPSDVIAGALLGGTVAWATGLYLRWAGAMSFTDANDLPDEVP